MTLLKFGTLRDLENLGCKANRVYGELPLNFTYSNTFLPKIDISENEKNIFINAELPGMKKEDINIKLENDVLTIMGEKKSDLDKERTIIRNERVSGTFKRTFKFEEEINPDTVSAELTNGVLTIVLEKVASKAAKERQIQVK